MCNRPVERTRMEKELLRNCMEYANVQKAHSKLLKELEEIEEKEANFSDFVVSDKFSECVVLSNKLEDLKCVENYLQDDFLKLKVLNETYGAVNRERIEADVEKDPKKVLDAWDKEFTFMFKFSPIGYHMDYRNLKYDVISSHAFVLSFGRLELKKSYPNFLIYEYINSYNCFSLNCDKETYEELVKDVKKKKKQTSELLAKAFSQTSKLVFKQHSANDTAKQQLNVDLIFANSQMRELKEKIQYGMKILQVPEDVDLVNILSKVDGDAKLKERIEEKDEVSSTMSDIVNIE
jgi:hypothetical protein